MFNSVAVIQLSSLIKEKTATILFLGFPAIFFDELSSGVIEPVN